MTDHGANKTTGFRVRDYLRMATRKARLREALKLSAAVCQQKLSVEEACNLHGLKLDDVLHYLTMRGYLPPPTSETERHPMMTSPGATQTGVHLNEIV